MLFFPVLSDSWELKHATRNISPTNNQANIVDLHPASVYSIRMYSYNAIGKSEASKELTISTEEARKSFDSTAFYLRECRQIFYFLLVVWAISVWICYDSDICPWLIILNASLNKTERNLFWSKYSRKSNASTQSHCLSCYRAWWSSNGCHPAACDISEYQGHMEGNAFQGSVSWPALPYIILSLFLQINLFFILMYVWRCQCHYTI